ncbi:MAG TPA: hypothetical protein DCS93_03490 [Microscillaceae bacterium]|nr:hypothetical protein [Microscillaceae bacterium]
MEKRLKNAYLFLLSFLIFTQCAPREQPPKAKRGALDLTSYNFEKSGILPLGGEVNFFWKKLYVPQDFSKSTPKNGWLFQLPNAWNGDQETGKEVTPLGYGTYRMQIKLPDKNLKLAIKMLTVGTAYRMFINDEEVTTVGKVGTSKANTQPSYLPQVIAFTNLTQEINLTIQVANFHYRYGGIWQQMSLGLEKDLREERERSTIIDFFLIGSIFIMALYHLGLYWIRRKNVSALYFGLCCLMASLRLSVTDQYLIRHFTSNDWFINVRLEFFTLHAGPLVFLWFFYSLFPKDFPRKILWVISIVFGLLGLSNLILSPYLFSQALPISQLTVLVSGAYAIFGLVRAIMRKREGALLFMGGFLFLFTAIVNDILYANYTLNTGHQFGTGLFLFIFSQAFVLAYRFSRAMSQNEKLTEELNYTNKNLEKLVDERTNELRDSNDQLNQYVEELDQINHVLSANNQEIHKKNKDITDSINYASNIQKALLPLEEDLAKSIPEYFIFYRPRDIVSGDFYWFSQVKHPETGKLEKILFAVVDCTGHGVPGAFMSMLGMEGLNNIINRQHTLEPKEILIQLHEYISITLHQRLNNLRDGMDIALTVIDLPKRQVAFAGAHNPLVVIQNNELQLIKGSPLSIGGFVKNKTFEQHTFSLAQNSTLYMYTDGFQDQFGGPENRKFMKKRLRQLLFDIHHRSMSEQKQILQSTIEEWMEEGHEKQIDDILVAGLRFGFSD